MTSKKLKPVKAKRISFGEFEAARIYEWWIALRQGLGERCCENCDLIAARLSHFIGKRESKELARLVAKYPYFKAGDHRPVITKYWESLP